MENKVPLREKSDHLAAVRTRFVQRSWLALELFGKNGLANHAAAGAYGFLLSVAPALLIVSFFVSRALESSPEAVADIIFRIGFFRDTFDIRELISAFLSSSHPGISGIVSVIAILWASMTFAVSMQRGLGVVFAETGNRGPFSSFLVTLGIELLSILFIFIAVLNSQLALFLYQALGYIPLHLIQNLQIPSLIIPFAALLLLSFASYYAAPVVRPRKRSAAAGALICIALYILLSLVFDVVITPTRYNFLYGALGNLILLLARVYFFFIFFFLGAEITFVIDSFDALLFVRFIKIESNPRIKKNSFERRVFSSPNGPLAKYRRSYKEGETIFSQGESDREVYYMLSGEAEFYMDTGSEESPVHKTGTIRAGTFFGEVGYLLSQGRSATVIAGADITVMVLPPDLFEKIMRMDLLTDQRLIETLTERLKHSDKRLNTAGLSAAGDPADGLAGPADPELPSNPENAGEAGS
jgi:uncharacterized BrkB/YihY/UPF0761 family membrane protein